MKALARVCLVLAFVFATYAAIGARSAPALAIGTTHYVSPSLLTVPLDTSCDEPGYGSIQMAVAASNSGDTIVVCDGVYRETVTIDKDLTLLGSGNSVIQAPGSISDLVTVTGSVSVVMSGFVISGPGPTGCGSIQAGVRVRDGAWLDLSSTTIRDIRDVRDALGQLSGCQNGEAIRVGPRGDDGAGPGSLRLDGVVAVDYQKNGITVNGPGSNANIMNTTVRGGGPVGGAIIAQNGIQVSRGASATISTSTIRDNDYPPKTFVACGLLVFDANGVNDDTNIYLNNEKDKCTFGGRGGTYEGMP
jgi:hypothetical protein